MHDILRQRLMRKIESLPEDQVYQILDYIEFLESKYGSDGAEETSGLQRFGEAMEDKLRKTMSPAKVREAFQLIAAADKALSNVASAGKRLMDELTPGGDGTPDVIDSGDEATEGASDEAEPTADEPVDPQVGDSGATD